MKAKCLLYAFLLGALLLILLAPALATAVTEIGAALSVALVFAVATLCIVGTVFGLALVAEMRRPAYRLPPAVYWFEYSRPEKTSLPERRAQLADGVTVEGEFKEVWHDQAA